VLERLKTRRAAGLVFGIFLVGIFVAALIGSLSWDVPTGLFPWLAGSLGLIFALAQIFRETLGGEGTHTNEAAAGSGEGSVPSWMPTEAAEQFQFPPQEESANLTSYLWPFALLAAQWLVGFELGAFSVTMLYLITHRERYKIVIGLSIVNLAMVTVLFERLLQVSFPPGVLFSLLR
jgi:hypothetical protein